MKSSIRLTVPQLFELRSADRFGESQQVLFRERESKKGEPRFARHWLVCGRLWRSPKAECKG